jgi:hypothetical protein
VSSEAVASTREKPLAATLAGNGDLQDPAAGNPDCYSRCVQSRGLGVDIELGEKLELGG